MAVSKRLRFEVFKRDGFKCAYCGQTPPAVVLEVDHIEAKSNGGKDDINNLITACFDCNRGKTNIPLSSIPPQVSENIEALKEREEQIKEYRKYIKKIEGRIKGDVSKIAQLYEDQYEGWAFSDSFKLSVKRFIESLPINEVEEAMLSAIGRFPSDKDKVIKYFCGICWNKIKAKTDPEHSTFKELKKYWKNQKRGSGYLPDNYLRVWMRKYDTDTLKTAMDRAEGIWDELKDDLGGI